VAVRAASLGLGQEEAVLASETVVEDGRDTEFFTRLTGRRPTRILSLINVPSREKPAPRLHVIHQHHRPVGLIEQREVNSEVSRRRGRWLHPVQRLTRRNPRPDVLLIGGFLVVMRADPVHPRHEH
jgi:hypothetical protein